MVTDVHYLSFAHFQTIMFVLSNTQSTSGLSQLSSPVNYPTFTGAEAVGAEGFLRKCFVF